MGNKGKARNQQTPPFPGTNGQTAEPHPLTLRTVIGIAAVAVAIIGALVSVLYTRLSSDLDNARNSLNQIPPDISNRLKTIEASLSEQKVLITQVDERTKILQAYNLREYRSKAEGEGFKNPQIIPAQLNATAAIPAKHTREGDEYTINFSNFQYNR